MKNFLLILLILVFALSCEIKHDDQSIKFNNLIVPIPKNIQIHSQDEFVVLNKNIPIFCNQPQLYSLVDVLKNDLQNLSGIDFNFSNVNKEAADLIFEIDSNLQSEEYNVNTIQKVILKGGSYRALAMAKSTLVQILKINNNLIYCPIVKISDKPDSEYRGLLIDLARMWHDIPTLKKIIDLAAFYKINYLQLHLSDDQSFTFPSEKYPKLSTPDRPYSKHDFRDLVNYAKMRGIIIIPELDIPGHSRQFVEIYPEIFGVKNKLLQTNPSKSNVINIANEEVYNAIDDIIGEIIDVFDTSPFFHIGGDEANLSLYENVPEVINFMEKHDLGTDVHELFRYFIVRMNEIVKKHGKKMFLWEGFRREGKIKIPRDITVFEFETMYHLPGDLIEDGFSVVNTSWMPLYLVNGGVKQPRARRGMWSPEKIYSWNIWRWENWWEKSPVYKKPIQLEKTDQIIGGQMCSWEQAGSAEIPTLRKRLPIFIERVWNNEKRAPFEEFYLKVEANDVKLSKIINDSRQDTVLLGYDFEGNCLWCDN